MSAHTFECKIHVFTTGTNLPPSSKEDGEAKDAELLHLHEQLAHAVAARCGAQSAVAELEVAAKAVAAEVVEERAAAAEKLAAAERECVAARANGEHAMSELQEVVRELQMGMDSALMTVDGLESKLVAVRRELEIQKSRRDSLEQRTRKQVAAQALGNAGF